MVAALLASGNSVLRGVPDLANVRAFTQVLDVTTLTSHPVVHKADDSMALAILQIGDSPNSLRRSTRRWTIY